MRHVVITSIFPPTKAVRAFAAIEDWSLVVVGDRKTPEDWHVPGVEYLSPEWQTSSGYEIAATLPWDHYSRKMIGYLHAVARGATVIADTDDDNVPTARWSFPPSRGRFFTASGAPFYNVYQRFSKERVWPRGYPLRLVTVSPDVSVTVEEATVGVWQALADNEPDVDAVYRLTVGKPVVFEDADPIVLAERTMCPFNSQNTLFQEAVFPLLYLPATVTFRFTDILRSLVAQPILWAAGLRLGFLGATVRQDRNAHDFLDDFRSEIPMYLESERAAAAVEEAVDRDADVEANLRRAYAALAAERIVAEGELDIVDAWLLDLARFAR